MSNGFDVLVYLDEILVKNLASLVLTGFIETITLTQSLDNCLSAGMREGNKNESNSSENYTKIEREGFKDKTNVEANNNFTNSYQDRLIDGKRCVKEQRTVQTTYTTFVLNSNLMSYFNENKELNHKDVDDVVNDRVNVGDIIELEGTITNSSLISYVNTMINLLEVFECEYLDKLIEEKKGTLNFTRYYKLLQYLQKILTCNNTMDLIMKVGNGFAILTVGVENFMNNHCHAFDKTNCPCKVIGKVIKNCVEKDNCISLLRKTGQEKYYEKIFEESKELIEILKNNDITVPECPPLKFDHSAIQIMPLDIYM